MAIKLGLNITNGNENYTASVQHLVDCDYYNLGCNGGLQYRAYNYIKEKGFFSNQDYFYKTYLVKQMECKDREVWRKRRLEPSLIASGWVNETAYSIKAFLQYQPIGATVNTPWCFNFYEKGILTESSCSCAKVDSNGPVLTHAVTIVGFNDDNSIPECSGYWIVKNSWSERWGENGYGRLCIPKDDQLETTGTCHI